MKKQNIIGPILTCIIAVIVIAVIFYPSAPAQRLAIDTHATEQSVSDLSDEINKFSFNLYKHLITDEQQNMFFSPYSIHVALAMVYEGAQGETADEMKAILGFPQNNETNLCSFGRIYNLLNQDTEYTLSTANALWTKKNYKFLDEYLRFINSYYMGKATDVNFDNPQQATQIINQWVEENTAGKIKDLIETSAINMYTRLILTNAIYFKGDWLYQFDPEDTVDGDFTITPEEIIHVPMMSHTETDIKLKYYESEDMQLVELPYKGEDLSMIILLPKEIDISSFEQTVTYEDFISWMESATTQTVQVTMPKFTMETEYQLKETLQDMGMILPFSEIDADFSGMTGNKDLYIAWVVHKGFIEVNEQGTEAAAATAVGMELTSMPMDIKEFNANHPFLYLIQQKETGTILFMGKVVNPLV